MTRSFQTHLALFFVCFALGGCQGIVWANLAAVFVTVGLFLGTVQLRRGARPAVQAGNAIASVHTAHTAAPANNNGEAVRSAA